MRNSHLLARCDVYLRRARAAAIVVSLCVTGCAGVRKTHLSSDHDLHGNAPRVSTDKLVYPLSVDSLSVSNRCLAGDDDLLPVTLHEVVQVGLIAFRHRYGSLEVVPAAGCLQVILPPDLDRQQQLEIFAAVDEHVRDCVMAYIDLWFAWEQTQSLAAIEELHRLKTGAERSKTDSGQPTNLDLVASETALVLAKIQRNLARHEGVGEVGLAAARRRLLSLLAVECDSLQLVPIELPMRDSHLRCWNCDVASAMACNSQLLVEKMQLAKHLNVAPEQRGWLKRACLPEPAQTDLRQPMHLDGPTFELAKQRERQLIEHLAALDAKLHALESTEVLLAEHRTLVEQQMTIAQVGVEAKAATSTQVYDAGLGVLQSDVERHRLEMQLAKAAIDYQWVSGRLLEFLSIEMVDLWFCNDLQDLGLAGECCHSH